MSLRSSSSDLLSRASLGLLSDNAPDLAFPASRKESVPFLARSASPSERTSLGSISESDSVKSPRASSSASYRPVAVMEVLESLVPRLAGKAVILQTSPLTTSPVSDREEYVSSPKESLSEGRANRFQRGKELLREGLYEEAISYFVHAAEYELPVEGADVFRARCFVNMGICYSGLDNVGLAYSCLDEAIDICVKSKKSGVELESVVSNACFAKGVLLSKQRRHDEAIELITKGLNLLKSDCAWMVFLRGWNLFYLKQLDYSIEDFRKAKVLFDDSKESGSSSLSTDADDLFDIIGHPFNFVSEEDSKEWLCESLKIKAKSMGKSDNLGQVIAAIDELLSMRPDKEYYIALKATALVGLKRYEDASLHLTTAIDLNPRHAPYYVNRAYTYYKMCLFSFALKDYQTALELDGKCEEALEGIEKIMAARKKLQSKIQKAALYHLAPHEAA